MTAEPYAFRFELAAPGPGGLWVGTTTIGSSAFAPVAARAGGVASDIDVFRADPPLESIRLRIRLQAASEVLSAPCAVTVSACDSRASAAATWARRALPRLPVPAVSQMEAPPELRMRICSPASLAMVLGYWGISVDAETLAAETFCRELDLYGVWPAAIAAAARRGVAGYLLRFPDWAAAEWCLEHGLPIVASVRYAAGELTGAAVTETAGHLLVLTGRDGDQVLVNDPAAPSADTVPRRYPLRELCRAWLDGSAVGYVFFRTDVRVPTVGTRSDLRGSDW